jgi:hypothetical protein
LTRAEDVAMAIVSRLDIVVLTGEAAVQATERSLSSRELLLVLDNLVVSCARVLVER